MTDEKIQRNRDYHREYRRKNRDALNKKHHEWITAHPEKAKEYQLRYWEKRISALKGEN